MLAPIALFVYNRLWHTKQTIDALRSNELAAQSELFVFSDGPKNETDAVLVEEVKRYLKNVSGFKKIEIIEKKENCGLANSIIAGLDAMMERFDRVIVLEDDLVTSPFFLKYMNEALDLYVNEEKVVSVHGYVYPVKAKLPETFFLRGADCWGWATWKRAWNLFEPDGTKLLRALNENDLTKRFDFNGGYPFTKMLEEQTKGRNDSWAIRWYALAFLEKKLTLYPGKSLIKNIGFDKSGVHSGHLDMFGAEVSEHPVVVQKIIVEEDLPAFEIIERYFKSPRVSLMIKLMKIKHLLKRFLNTQKNLNLNQ